MLPEPKPAEWPIFGRVATGVLPRLTSGGGVTDPLTEMTIAPRGRPAAGRSAGIAPSQRW